MAIIAQPFIDHISKRVNLSKTDIDTILSCIEIVPFKKNDTILRQGEICKFNYYVLSGCLKTFHTDKNGDEHIVAFAVEDWWTGDLASMFTQTEADYSVTCLEESELIQISAEHLNSLYDQIPMFERFFRLLLEKAYVHAQKRIINNFSLPAKERYKIFVKKHPQFLQRVPQYLIASYLGITKEFLSKVRKEIAYE